MSSAWDSIPGSCPGPVTHALYNSALLSFNLFAPFSVCTPSEQQALYAIIVASPVFLLDECYATGQCSLVLTRNNEYSLHSTCVAFTLDVSALDDFPPNPKKKNRKRKKKKPEATEALPVVPSLESQSRGSPLSTASTLPVNHPECGDSIK